jgi:2,3-bisphosphoglycerate-independent phosphoglycerate mutase
MDSVISQKVMLLIMDGWGYGRHDGSNAVEKANTPFFHHLLNTYPNSKLEASGEFVGLPEGQMGNSEVGHMNLGAGRIVYQELVRINKAIREKTLDTNPELLKAFHYAKEKNTNLHFIGLLSDGGVHAHIKHLMALTQLSADHGLEKVFVHGFTDGRDTDPKGGASYVQELEDHLKKTTGTLSSLVGRYYAMDRDNRWERVKKAYDLLVKGIGLKSQNLYQSVLESYKEDVTDEFILPIIKTDAGGNPIGLIKPGDVVIFFNYRTDRGRELTLCLSQKSIPEQGLEPLDLYFVTMTQYDQDFKNIHIVFESDNLISTLGQVISENHKTQIRIAETEKYPHVTFFFSGGREEPFIGEKRLLIPSPKVATYDLQPEMSARGIVDAILPVLKNKEADFICLNFANPDMVGHTGVFTAVIKAVETVDACVKEVVETGIQNGYSFIILADHGNSEFMINADGTPNTAHTTNLVPCILISENYHTLKDGKLSDIAPTILTIMGIPVPKVMNGEILVS